jgi:hypothetical protein
MIARGSNAVLMWMICGFEAEMARRKSNGSFNWVASQPRSNLSASLLPAVKCVYWHPALSIMLEIIVEIPLTLS